MKKLVRFLGILFLVILVIVIFSIFYTNVRKIRKGIERREKIRKQEEVEPKHKIKLKWGEFALSPVKEEFNNAYLIENHKAVFLYYILSNIKPSLDEVKYHLGRYSKEFQLDEDENKYLYRLKEINEFERQRLIPKATKKLEEKIDKILSEIKIGLEHPVLVNIRSVLENYDFKKGGFPLKIPPGVTFDDNTEPMLTIKRKLYDKDRLLARSYLPLLQGFYKNFEDKYCHFFLYFSNYNDKSLFPDLLLMNARRAESLLPEMKDNYGERSLKTYILLNPIKAEILKFKVEFCPRGADICECDAKAVFADVKYVILATEKGEVIAIFPNGDKDIEDK